jgi:hypothetical protein
MWTVPPISPACGPPTFPASQHFFFFFLCAVEQPRTAVDAAPGRRRRSSPGPAGVGSLVLLRCSIGRALLGAEAPGDPRRLGLFPSQQVARAGRMLAPGRARPEAVRTRTGPRPAPRTGTCLLWSLSGYRPLTGSAPGPHRFGSEARRWSGRTRWFRTARRRSTRRPSGSWR